MTNRLDRLSRRIVINLNLRFGVDWINIFDTWTGGVLAIFVLALWEMFEKCVIASFCDQSYLIVSGVLKVLFFATIAALFVSFRVRVNKARRTMRRQIHNVVRSMDEEITNGS